VFTDRTQDFRQIVNQTESKTKVKPKMDQQKNKNYTTKFGMEAASIGKGIHETKAKLMKLTQLAKKTTLFDDPSPEIQDLTYVIKKDITTLTKQIEDLSLCKSQENHQTTKNSDNIVSTLKGQLVSTTNEFRKVLEIRTENIKYQQRSKSEFTGTSNALTSIPNQSYSEQTSDNNGEISITMPLQTQLRDYSRSRLDAVQSIESTIVELEGIFRHLAQLVGEQGESIERIDHDIDQSSNNLIDTQSQLLKYWASLSSSRGLKMKIFFVLIVFVVLFFVVFV